MAHGHPSRYLPKGGCQSFVSVNQVRQVRSCGLPARACCATLLKYGSGAGRERK